ncbi:MAG: PorP/SprF family type IX secretion system membrane protein [Bacteroidota bacterium]|nr:PorP/SprF family type IX secretion system membrane protein [Bacteroidota bacterium]
MHRYLVFFSCALICIGLSAQEPALPTDFRQHSLTQFNSSLWNATYAYDWNQPNTLSVWSRWQWQTIDGDPSTLFANYTHSLGPKATVGLGFLQHNTGTFLNTGGNANFVYAFPINDDVKLLAGINVFAFQQTVADEQYGTIEGLDQTTLESFEGFRVKFSPALRLMVNRFGVGLAFENGFGFNLSDSESATANNFKTIIGTLSNDFPLAIFQDWGESYFRPVVYVKSIPYLDTQFGVNGLLSTPKFWVQGGYNSFYGVSGGLGATFAKSFSIGGLVEFGTDPELDAKDPTLELIASYNFGKTEKKVREPEPDEEEEVVTEDQMNEEAQRQEELEGERQLALQREQDSIAQAQQLALQLKVQREKDSIAALQTQKVELRPNEKYEEVENEEGLEPGFYLIANVYGTQKYFDNFMKTLRQKGLEPKSFYRKLNKYNYVYLERYNSMEEARKARDSKFFGKYPDKTWIFRVKGN